MVCTQADAEANTELVLEADMEMHTEPELATAVAMVVATVGLTVAIMEVMNVAAQLVDWLAGLLVGRQALVAEVQAAADCNRPAKTARWDRPRTKKNNLRSEPRWGVFALWY